jgi:hypothetical protein
MCEMAMFISYFLPPIRIGMVGKGMVGKGMPE